MQGVYAFLFLAGLIPFFRAWRANRRTSLVHAVFWAGAAWGGWGLALVFGEPDKVGLEPLRYLALCFSGGAGVAVLGARRPHVGAWNFVVLGWLAVMLLPLAENLFLATSALDGPRIFFLAATLGVGVLNYFPTTVWPAALFLGLTCTAECLLLFLPDRNLVSENLTVFHILLLLIPWAAFISWGRPVHTAQKLDKLWLDFRNRFGLLWGQRVREQFQRSALHAGWPGSLTWNGWLAADNQRALTEEEKPEMVKTLQALLKRFGAEEMPM